MWPSILCRCYNALSSLFISLYNIAYRDLFQYYLRQRYSPTFLSVFINPFYFARKGLFKAIQSTANRLGMDVLDVGCGTSPYRSLIPHTSWRGLEIDTKEARLRQLADDFYDGVHFPYPSHSFDSLLCNQVLEHVFTPQSFIEELFRVLKPGGTLLLTVPFIWDEHEQPFDYGRYTSFGLRSLLEAAGFIIIEHRKIGTGATVLFQLANAYAHKMLTGKSISVRMCGVLLVIAPINLLGILLIPILPVNQDLYLDHLIVAERPL